MDRIASLNRSKTHLLSKAQRFSFELTSMSHKLSLSSSMKSMPNSSNLPLVVVEGKLGRMDWINTKHEMECKTRLKDKAENQTQASKAIQEQKKMYHRPQIETETTV